jgi:hypothetical protein
MFTRIGKKKPIKNDMKKSQILRCPYHGCLETLLIADGVYT